MTTGSVFENNKTQTVSLPDDARFPDGVKRVHVRVMGFERILSPAEKTWDSFFLSDDSVSEECLAERASQEQGERASF